MTQKGNREIHAIYQLLHAQMAEQNAALESSNHYEYHIFTVVYEGHELVLLLCDYKQYFTLSMYLPATRKRCNEFKDYIAFHVDRISIGARKAVDPTYPGIYEPHYLYMVCAQVFFWEAHNYKDLFDTISQMQQELVKVLTTNPPVTFKVAGNKEVKEL